MTNETTVPAPRLELILLSGLLCDDSVWSDIADILAPTANIKTISFPGFSSIEMMAEHVLASAPARFALAGHSMGGRVALEVFRRAPQRVLGLALLNTGTHGPAAHEAATRGRLIELARTQGMSALASVWLPPMLNAKADGPREPLTERLTHMVERATPESFAAQIQALLSRPDATGVLLTVNIPTLLLSADGDTWSPPSQHQAMHARCPAADLIIVENAGHMSIVEQPAAVAASLHRWLLRIAEAREAMNSQWDEVQGLSDIPGTTVFTGEMARIGFHLNQFCMSLMKSDNRKRFKADEAAYLEQWPVTPEQKSAVLRRDYAAMMALGGNIYFLAKIGATDGWPFIKVAATMSGMTEEEYRHMMSRGGRSVEGLRSSREVR